MRKTVIGSLAMLLLVSCNNTTTTPIHVGLMVWPSYELFYLAEHQGYYNPDSIKLISFYTPSEAIRAYRTHQLDVLFVTNQLYLDMNDEELQDRIIMVVDYSAGADLLVAREGITEVKELEGKRVAAEANALGVYVLLRMLELNGMSREDINYIPTDIAEQLEGYASGQFDAVVTYEPFAAKMKTPGANELLNSSVMPYEISDLVIASPAVIKKHKSQLTALFKGFFRAQRDFQTEPEKYAPVLARREDISDQELLAVFHGLELLGLKENRELFNSPDSGFYQTLTLVSEKMVQYGIISNRYETQEMIDNSILEELSYDVQ